MTTSDIMKSAIDRRAARQLMRENGPRDRDSNLASMLGDAVDDLVILLAAFMTKKEKASNDPPSASWG